jgi:hypothetical protein
MIERIVCWFSCGAASAVATKLAIVENAGKLPLTVVRCIVREEHPDNDRFAAECEKWFGVPIVNLINEKYDGSIYEVFRKESYISGIKGAPCTRLLKKAVRLKFELPTDRQVFGYCAEELDRWNDFLDANNIDAVSPLIERGLRHPNCLSMVQSAGIELPVMYKLGYQHNNCIGCCKATGQGYWNKIKIDFPEQFERMVVESRRLGVRMIRIKNVRSFLDELVPGAGNYQDEPEIQCGIFCEAAQVEIKREVDEEELV